MKSARLTNILLGLTAFSAIASILFCWLVLSRARDIGRLQPQAAAVQQNQMLVQSMLNELVEYGKRDPQIKPLLQSVIGKPAAAQPAAK